MDTLFDPRAPEFLADPYPHYRRLREAEPVHRARLGDAGREVCVFVLSRFADCVSVLRDPRFTAEKDFRQMLGAGAAKDAPDHPAVAFFDAVMLFRDAPDHTRIRLLVNKAFTSRRVEALRPRVQEIVDELLDARAADGGMDLIHDFAAPLPVRVIAELLGVPPEDYEQLKHWSDRVATLLDGSLREDNQDEAVKSLVEFASYLGGIIGQRKAAPRDDLVSALVLAQEADDRLTDMEVLATCLLVLGAGHETTTNLIGNGMKALLDHPGELAKLRRDPSLVRTAVEELLRFDSPVQVTSRIARQDVVIGGRAIESGMEVNTLIGAANRDPAQFHDPDRLVLDRNENRHLSFGHGAHFCLGAPLARLEGELAFTALLGRFPGLQLACEPKLRPGFVLRGFESLALRF